MDWKRQLREAVTTASGLDQALTLTPSERQGALRAEQAGLPISVTPYYLSLIDPSDPADPIRRQCIPDAREAEEHPGHLVDPLGEDAHMVAPHLVQRYPDRVLLLATDRCAVYCRFCTRSRMVGGRRRERSRKARCSRALDYIAAHPEVRDVIGSGGRSACDEHGEARANGRRDSRHSDGRDDPPRDACSGHAADAHRTRATPRAQALPPALGHDALQPCPRGDRGVACARARCSPTRGSP